MAIIIASTLLLPPSPLSSPRQKPFPPPPIQSSAGNPHHFLCRSLPLTINQHITSSSPTTTRMLGHYANLASNLVLRGRLNEFLTIAESILTSDAISGAERAGFIARIEAKLFSEGISAVIRDGRLADVLEFLGRVEKLGIRPLGLIVGSAVEAFEGECRRLMKQGRLEEFVRLMEILAGYGIFINDVSNPGATIKLFVEQRQPEIAVRYASLFPQFRLLVCSIIQEFGKKKDKFSATRTYKAFSEKFDDMHVCRCLIDVYGICGDFLKSRQLFEGLLAKNVTPNIFIFNSLMNVNCHDLSYTLNVYSHMHILGVTADMTSYNILLKACHKARRVDLAQKIYKEAKQVALDGAFKLDIITYSTMMKMLKCGKWLLK